MGLLDDAIREHLDLKRRRGADPGEVERAEREALGPVRRGLQVADAEHPDLGDETDYDDGLDGTGAPWSDDWEQHDSPAADGEEEFEEDTDLPATSSGNHVAPDPHSASSSPEEDRDAMSEPGQETAEYHIESAPEERSPAKREDVLEETPEFLQDTPDHDRLWFEQRPPRDFDFDG